MHMQFIKQHKWIILSCVLVFVIVAAAEFFMGRSGFGPDGRFGWWDGNIYGSENSQRVFDAYSLTHVIHGFLFYFFLWLVARKLSPKHRLIAAIVLEGAWEILENSPFIIDRYRNMTVNYGYVGDSVLNSLSDIVMMAIGFWVAWRAKVWQSVLAIVGIELLLLWCVRDNLTLNIIMLIHPVDAIKNWQAGGQALLKLK